MRLSKSTYLGSSIKFLYFETEIAKFVGISKKLLLFYWKCHISWETSKFATFSINYVKLKLFNQLLQSQFIVANILVSLYCSNLSIPFNFSYIYIYIYISCLLSMNLKKPNAFLLYKTFIFELKPIFFYSYWKHGLAAYLSFKN